MACDGASPERTVNDRKPTPAPVETKAPAVVWGINGATPNTFLADGSPTFVVATKGEAKQARNARGQGEFLAGSFFPSAKVVDDTELATRAGVEWPAHPVLYGGPHVHASLAPVVADLPFSMTTDSLRIGGQTFEGPGIQLIAVVPSRRPGWPEFLLYAGTGADGEAEINAVATGRDQILIADAFGALTTGRWELGDDGRLLAKLEPPARRIEWRSVPRTLKGGHAVDFRFPTMVAADATDDAVIDAGLRGLRRARKRLMLDELDDLQVFVYPDVRSKQSLTKAGDGHAAPAARALHVLRGDPSHPDALVSLMAHEGTHVLLRSPWGSPGTAWMGEGIAVWASGSYAGQTLDEWATRVEPSPIADLLGRPFFSAPEAQKYPLAGLFVDVAVAEVGLAAVRDHLYGATPAQWEAACTSAGTSAAALQNALTRRLAR